MRFIRLSIFNYENAFSPISPPLYLDMGFVSTLSGSVPDSSSLGLTTTGNILIGMTDWALTDSSATIRYNLTLSTLSYTQTSSSLTRSQTGYLWYRIKTCPDYYY